MILVEECMDLTPYHAKYFAHELTKRCSSDSIEKLAGAVASAQVELNPHQVNAGSSPGHGVSIGVGRGSSR